MEHRALKSRVFTLPAKKNWKRFLSDNRGLLAPQLYLLPANSTSYSYYVQ